MSETMIGASGWTGTAPRFEPPRAVLNDGDPYDLIIVGAGILGLTAALHAARQGLSVIVLDAGKVGGAASGLNGGQVIAGLKYDPDELIERFGEVRGEALIRFGATTPDAVFDMIEREHLDVPHARTGWIQAAHSEAAAKSAERRARQWSARGVAAKALSAAEVARMTGARGYVGGWLDPRCGIIQPLAFTLELARIASSAGVRIAEKTSANHLERRDNSWKVETSAGVSLHSKSVIVATNAYADDLVPGLARTLVPLHSFQIATAPLPPAILAGILPGEQAVADSRRIVVYYRKSPDGRVMLGGRGSMSEPSSPQDWAHLVKALHRLFPVLAETPIEKRWFGRVAMTLDHLPHIHEPEPGLVIAAGCQGRGVGLMTALGPRLVDYIRSRDASVLPFDISPIRPIPLHGFRNLGIGAAIAWYQLLDSLDR